MKLTFYQKIISILSVFLVVNNTNSQTNIIPNGDFENSTTTNTNLCFNAFFINNNAGFNSIVNNWKVAEHKNSASNNSYVGLVSFIDVLLCSSGDKKQTNTYPKLPAKKKF
jgi:hypothetical protein